MGKPSVTGDGAAPARPGAARKPRLGPRECALLFTAGLTETVTLNGTRTVLVFYQISAYATNLVTAASWRFLHTQLWHNGATELKGGRAVSGDTGTQGEHTFFTNSGLWAGALEAGTHTFNVKYRASAGSVSQQLQVGDANQFGWAIHVVTI